MRVVSLQRRSAGASSTSTARRGSGVAPRSQKLKSILADFAQ